MTIDEFSEILEDFYDHALDTPLDNRVKEALGWASERLEETPEDYMQGWNDGFGEGYDEGWEIGYEYGTDSAEARLD